MTKNSRLKIINLVLVILILFVLRIVYKALERRMDKNSIKKLTG